MESQQDSHGMSMGYGLGPPWLFSGRAIYQLHLVKANVAKRFIPSDLKIVQAFGYTLGGMYLAQYDNSPAGSFDELVVIAGTVWNPPTSCAWAARVLVSSLEACDHGKKEVGLPSHQARFLPVERPPEQQQNWPWWNFSRFRSGLGQRKNETHKQCGFDISELEGSSEKPFCHIALPKIWAKSEAQQHWRGPSVSLSLPSFSGRTQEQPQLLKYSCQLKCSVNVIQPAIVTVPLVEENIELQDRDPSYNSVLSLLAAKPLLALGFENMLMNVEGPVAVTSGSEKTESPKIMVEIKSWSPVSIKAS